MRPNYTDASLVTKYELPPSEYEKRDDSVLAWKKAKKLGRFDPVRTSRIIFSPSLILLDYMGSEQTWFLSVGVGV